MILYRIFDANTLVFGEIIYSPAAILDIALGAPTIVLTDAYINIPFGDDGLAHDVVPVLIWRQESIFKNILV